jgi:hypothetical protein
VASILQFTSPPQPTFDPETTALMGEAFDLAMGGLQDAGLPAIAQEMIARRIVTAVGNGERDPGRLASSVLKSLGISA